MRYLLSPLLCLALVAVVTGCDAVDTADGTLADAAQVAEFPFLVFVQTCDGESVLLAGTNKIVFHIRGDSNGGFHLTGNWNIHATGVGDQGNEYLLNYSDNLGFNLKAGITFNWVGNFTVVEKGQGRSFQFRFVRHATVNANGDVTAEMDEFASLC